jgi:hypothetical protein
MEPTLARKLTYAVVGVILGIVVAYTIIWLVPGVSSEPIPTLIGVTCGAAGVLGSQAVLYR